MDNIDRMMKVHEFLTKIDDARKELDSTLDFETPIEKESRARKHTQEWYARHYGKLEDWARTILPRPWRDQFFHCIANGLWDPIQDRGEKYTTVAGFDVIPSNYFDLTSAHGQMILDQTRRAEEAEVALENMTKERDEWKAACNKVIDDAG